MSATPLERRPVALVAGGSRGIGRVVCLSLARAGYDVALGSRKKSDGEILASEIRKLGSRVFFQSTDVAQEVQVCSLVEATVRELGGLDVACNCAGLEGNIGSVVEQDITSCRQLLEVNVVGTFLCLKYEVAQMLSAGGSIVNMASIAALKGVSGAAPYAANKHAVLGLTRSVALEYARRGIRVNAVCPGLVDTDMARRLALKTGRSIEKLQDESPMGRMATAEEVALLVVWLLSSEASIRTGQAVGVDGGLSIA